MMLKQEALAQPSNFYLLLVVSISLVFFTITHLQFIWEKVAQKFIMPRGFFFFVYFKVSFREVRRTWSIHAKFEWSYLAVQVLSSSTATSTFYMSCLGVIRACAFAASGLPHRSNRVTWKAVCEMPRTLVFVPCNEWKQGKNHCFETSWNPKSSCEHRFKVIILRSYTSLR